MALDFRFVVVINECLGHVFFSLFIFQYFYFLTNIIIFHFLQCFEYYKCFWPCFEENTPCMMVKIIHKDEKIMWAKSLKGSTWVHVSQWMEYVKFAFSSIKFAMWKPFSMLVPYNVVFTNLFNKQEVWYPSHKLKLICWKWRPLKFRCPNLLPHSLIMLIIFELRWKPTFKTFTTSTCSICKVYMLGIKLQWLSKLLDLICINTFKV